MTRLLALPVAALLLGAVLFYVSRFWIFDLWPREGLFGIAALRPGGNLVQGWLGGTPFWPFDLVIWAVIAFLLLTLAQKIADLLGRR